MSQLIAPGFIFIYFYFFLGFASVYGHKVSEIDEMLEVRQIAGVCPQSDIHFDILTVEENLSIFAAIKGIPQNDLIQEVSQAGHKHCLTRSFVTCGAKYPHATQVVP